MKEEFRLYQKFGKNYVYYFLLFIIRSPLVLLRVFLFLN